MGSDGSPPAGSTCRAAHGFVRDHDLAGYDPRTDFCRFLMKKGRASEAAGLRLLRNRCEIVPIGESAQDSRDPDKALETLEGMKAGVDAIHCAVLHAEPTQTYGMPDLLVRGDVLERLFPGVYALEPSGSSTRRAARRTLPRGSWPSAWVPLESSRGVRLRHGVQLGQARHPDRAWPDPRLFDLLNLVVREEPVVVRGALGFETRAEDGARGHGGRVEPRGGGTAERGGDA